MVSYKALNTVLELIASFNRTFMELKLMLTHIFRNLLTVLIVPLWN